MRVILAISVVLAHSGPLFGLSLVNGITAVEMFFMISGFYMALVLNEKYTGKGSYKLFITNRFLRIYPTYWIILFFTLALSFIITTILKNDGTLEQYLLYYKSMNLDSMIFLFFTHIVLFGQDAVMFLQLSPKDGSLLFSDNFVKSNPQLWKFLFVPQAWSLSLELLFYVIAPIIVRKKASIIVMFIAISLLLRFYVYYLGFTNDPWNYRFFPFEIAFFLSGSLAYKIYYRFKAVLANGKPAWITTFAFVFIALICIYQFIPASELIKSRIYFVALFLSIPLLFSFSKRNKVDKFIGELSYPVYISHWMILFLMKSLTVDAHFLGLITAVASILFSIILIKYVINPIDTLRNKRVKNQLRSRQLLTVVQTTE